MTADPFNETAKPTEEEFDEFVVTGAPNVKPATYPATLTGLKIKHMEFDGEQVDRVVWEFAVEVDGGDPMVIDGMTSKASGPNSRAFEFMTALAGSTAVVTGARFRAKDLVGRECLVAIENNDKGWPRVKNVMAPVARR